MAHRNIHMGLIEESHNWAIAKSDFFEPPAFKQFEGVIAVTSGAGAAILKPGIAYDFTNHPGVGEMLTGTTATGAVFILSGAAGLSGMMSIGVGGITRIGTWFQPGSILSTPLERFWLRAGLGSVSAGAVLLQGVTFEYRDDINGGRWQANCTDSVGTTVADTGVLVVGGTYYALEIEIDAGGAFVEFFIDGVSVATITANIEAGSAFQHFYNCHIFKVVGTTSREAYIDKYYLMQQVTR